MDDFPPARQPLLLEALSFRFPGIDGAAGAAVLEDLQLAVTRGETAVMFGRADAGKTTLSRIAAGLVPRFTGGALAGAVRVGGRDSTHTPPYELMQSVGLVAQDSEEQILTTRCDAEVAFALESLGVPRPEMREKVDASLARVGLAAFGHRNPATLSGGEKKRLLAACLAAIRPGLWILDEALGELDFEWKVRILDLAVEAGGTLLLMESRWSPLASARGTSFFLLDERRIRATAARAADKGFSRELASAGIRQAAPRKRKGESSGDFLGIQGVSFSFEESASFSLQVDALQLRFGEVCALVGKNGSGKSTLGKLLCGLLLPRRGAIGRGGAWGFKPARPGELSLMVGYLFQNPDHQIYLPTVREELGMGLRRQGADKREIEARVLDAAAIFGLADIEAPPSLLSYGARKRLQAATYYLLSRDLLVLDEIDSGLSYREVESLVDALSSRRPGIVLITHDMALATASCDRILVMEGGRITVDAPSDTFDAAEAFSGLAVLP